jgi:hypothetical protein
VINWDEPKQGQWRAFDSAGRVVGRVNQHHSSLECSAYVDHWDLGVFISVEHGKQAVSKRLTRIPVEGERE